MNSFDKAIAKAAKELKRVHRGYGENHYNAKLTDRQIIEIKALYYAKYKQREIANMYNITQAMVSSIVNNKRRNRN